jgi:polyhydroxyalkanoate synthase
VKETFDTCGTNLARGLGNFARNVRHNGGLRSMVEPDVFEDGRDLAVTPGVVDARDEVGELLH